MTEPFAPLDREHMERALAEARLGAERDEVPVGAVLVAPDGTVFADHNRTREAADPTAHAEVRVIRRAAERLGDWRLLGHTLYVTLEPCAMCIGAIVQARVARVVFGAYDLKAGAAGSVIDLSDSPAFNHRFEVLGGVLAEECGAVLKEFFSERRL